MCNQNSKKGNKHTGLDFSSKNYIKSQLQLQFIFEIIYSIWIGISSLIMGNWFKHRFWLWDLASTILPKM